jgi:N-formylglutamate amidohydrolase
MADAHPHVDPKRDRPSFDANSQEQLLPMSLAPPAIYPPRADFPVLLSVPHAGRDYPDWLIALCKGGHEALHTLEDPFVDELVEGAVDSGIAAVVARAPRAAVDCNRAEDEIDPAVVRAAPLPSLSPRARGGLGIVPGRTATHGPLWRQPIPRQELEERLDQAHRPYHRAIEDQLAQLLDVYGCALLLDCHSMPPPESGPSVIIGDRYGQSAAPWVTAEAVKIVSSMGFRVGVNQPFAGGHVVQRHGAPQSEVHALQIEIDRRCYLAADGSSRGPGFDQTARLIEQLAVRLGQHLLDRRFARAAE